MPPTRRTVTSGEDGGDGGGEGGDSGDGGGGEGDGGGGAGKGAVYTHTFADTPDGGEHEPIINSECPLCHPGITRKGLLQPQWPVERELEWTPNESE